LPLLAARGAFGRRERMIDVGQNRASIGEQRRAGIGQLDAARLAAEQLHLELLLQGADLHAQRRLLDAQTLGRPGHVPFLGDRDEITQVTQLHLPYVSNINC